jgi:hypothetical protein
LFVEILTIRHVPKYPISVICSVPHPISLRL